ncbi:MAG TPA: DUF2171 domain-containing protein [Sphingomicrobium sp.]|nr:DUF2171 domain-containing protein [Sphingomicrobium sp.]
MAYDRYDTRRDWREGRARWRDDDRFGNGSFDRDRFGRDRDDRGWFERAGDEIASWFGDEEAERRRRQDNPDRFSGHLRNEEDIQRYYGDREPRGERDWRRDRDFGRRERFATDRDRDFDRGRAFMSDEDFTRYERSPRWRDEGYRRPYTGRFTGRGDFGGDRGERAYRPMAGDYGRSSEFESRMERGGSFYGVGAHHDRHYGELRQRHLDELDRDYEDYARENRSRFEDDFTSWRDRRQQKRGLLGQVREHMEVLGSDGEPVGTVDRTAGDRIILTKSDPEAGGAHHSLMCTSIDRIEEDKVILDMTAEQAKQRWRDDSRERALFEREDQGEAGPGVLSRSFSGTY